MLDEPSVLLRPTFGVLHHLPDSLATMKDSGVRWGRGGASSSSSSSGCGRGAVWRDTDRLLAWQDMGGDHRPGQGRGLLLPCHTPEIRVKHL